MPSMIVDEMREGSASIKRGNGTALTFSSTFKFLVLTDSPTTSREEVLLNTTGLPIVGVVYGLIQAVCTSKTAVRDTKNPLYWHVTCEFDTGREYQKQNPSDPDSPDPTTWLPVFVVDAFETKERVLHFDKSPTPKKCMNSAGDPFSEPITEIVTNCSCTFTQFENPTQHLSEIMDRNETVNSREFFRKAKRTLKLNVLSAELGYYGGFSAWRVGYRMTLDRDTWDEKRLDVGPNYLASVGAATYQMPCMNLPERRFRVIGHLDGNGNQLQANQDPAVLIYRTKTELDFNTFIRV